MTTATRTDGSIAVNGLYVSEVRIKLLEGPAGRARLLGFAAIILNGAMAVRDLKIVDSDGVRFLAMPSRKLCDRCPHCGAKGLLSARFCHDCGRALESHRATRDERGREKLHADVAHPINRRCREMIGAAVLAAHDEEVRLSKLPGYVSSWDAAWDEGGEG